MNKASVLVETLSEVWRKGQEQWSWDLGKDDAAR